MQTLAIIAVFLQGSGVRLESYIRTCAEDILPTVWRVRTLCLSQCVLQGCFLYQLLAIPSFYSSLHQFTYSR
ncbi:hypothetical protein BDD12DRAFT_868255 [Trichophaea hybrida]|nr:hypothetical protein BDD12DRAFT_868255 [Trichophaea hybrida]